MCLAPLLGWLLSGDRSGYILMQNMPLVLNKGSQREASAQLPSLTGRLLKCFWSKLPILLGLSSLIYYIELIALPLNLEIQLISGFLFLSPCLSFSGFPVDSQLRACDGHVMRGNYQAGQDKKSETGIWTKSSQWSKEGEIRKPFFKSLLNNKGN